MGYYSGPDYSRLAKRGFFLGLALFVVGTGSELIGHAMFGALPSGGEHAVFRADDNRLRHRVRLAVRLRHHHAADRVTGRRLGGFVTAPASLSTMQTHIVPVGFDYDRLIAPLVRDQIDVDSVILLEGPSAARPTSSTLGISRRNSRRTSRTCSVPGRSGSSSRMSTTTTTPSSRPTSSSRRSSIRATRSGSTSPRCPGP